MAQNSKLMPLSSHTSEQETLFDVIMDTMEEGIILIDKTHTILAMNKATGRILGLEDWEMARGQKIEEVNARLFATSFDEYRATSPFFSVLKTGEAQYNVERKTRTGVYISVNFVPVIRGGEVTGVLATLNDITARKQLEETLVKANQELEEAFSLTLPNSKIKRKLKTTPEYCDVYHPDTGKIEITDVIPDGNYRHVINALKIFADLDNQQVTDLIGIDKDTIVQAILFHDIGKVQPRANVGDIVDPLEFFEDGRLHARRSAEMARHYYHQPDDVVHLIANHHHREEDLPPDYPFRLLPMLRLLKLVDGLSAAVTRRKATVSFEVRGSEVTIWEKNAHPRFNNVRTIDLYTGQQKITHWNGQDGVK